MDAQQAWQVALELLEREMSRSWFNRRVRDTHVVSYEGGSFCIGVSTVETQEWLADRLTSTVRSLLMGIMNRSVTVQFIVEAPQADEEKQEPGEAAIQPDQPGLKEPVVDMTQPQSRVWEGLTPLSDELVEKYGIAVAAVAGKIWMYSLMNDRVCRATLSRLALELKLSRRTIIRAIWILVANGYVADARPTLGHREHSYVATDRMGSFEPVRI